MIGCGDDALLMTAFKVIKIVACFRDLTFLRDGA